MDSKTHCDFQSTERRLRPPRDLLGQVRADGSHLADLIEALIEVREQQRDIQLAALRHDVNRLIDKLRHTTHQLLLEELACFKDILALHGERDRNPEEPAPSSTK